MPCALETLLLDHFPPYEKLSREDRMIFLQLLSEWNGTLEELAIAVTRF